MVKVVKIDDVKNLPKTKERIFLAEPKKFADFPDLLGAQKKGFNEFVDYYLKKLFDDINPIYDMVGDKLQLTITNIKIEQPIYDVEYCKKKELTYSGLMVGKVKLVDTQSGKTLFNKNINMGSVPLMTVGGSYLINGVERVVISQIVRSYGIFYSFDTKDLTNSFKVIPEKGSWFQIVTEKTGNLVMRINKSRKFSIISVLRIFGYESDESIEEIFKDSIDEEDFDYIRKSLDKDTTTDALDAAVYIYNKMRPGEIIDPENALDYIRSLFLSSERLHLGNVARRKINAKIGIDRSSEDKNFNVFDAEDFVAALKYLIKLNNNRRNYYADDIDHLSNRRIRTMGEVLYAHLQPNMRRFVKSIKGKLSVLNIDEPMKLTDIVNFKIFDNSIKSFFATSQLSQFLDQLNPLAEIEHKRRITALGPGGLKRETATFEVRDVHQSHYGRICPIETPEGQNIGLVVHQSLYSKLNEDGFIETPAVKVKKAVKPIYSELLNRIVDEDILDDKDKIIVKDNDYITDKIAKKIEKVYKGKRVTIKVRPFLTEEIEYISPELDEKYTIADSTVPLDEHKNIMNKRVAARHFMDMEIFVVNDITHVDVNPSQIFSSNTSLIPFVDHDDTVRASMGTNMQRQALPLVKPEAPLVGTGLEKDIASMTHVIIRAEGDGEVVYVDSSRIKIKYKKEGTKEYKLDNFKRSNQKGIIHQYPKVDLGQKIKKGDLLAEGNSIVDGEISLGKNLKVAFMSWEGYNYEDAVIVSQKLVKNDELTSIHIDEYEIEISDTKLGSEETTNDIPGVALFKLKNLTENGITRIGSIVKGGDILVGKITPKSEGELSPEEKLIHAIFGDKSKNYKDTSLYLPAGGEGKVIDIIELDSKKGDNLLAGVRKKIKVYVATTRKIEVGDKMAGRHGNKGIISIVVPEEDMPFTEDGEPVDIVLNPLGVVSRMNLGQVLEVQLGLVAKSLGLNFAVPLFSGFGSKEIKQLLKDSNLSQDGKVPLYDGKTGELYDHRITVGYMHMLKLSHMVEDKIHARSVGAYSLITQQPLGGKARDGGQRFGEMEVWALQAYSAISTLQEILTIKSDDVMGRNKAYEAIINSSNLNISGLPESFNLLMFVFKGLCQSIIPLSKEEIEKVHKERIQKIVDLGLRGITSKELLKETKNITENITENNDSKEEVINNVIEELKDFGELD